MTAFSIKQNNTSQKEETETSAKKMSFPFNSLHRAAFANLEPGQDPFNQNSNRSDREKWSTSKRGPVFSKLFRLDRADPLSFGPKFSEILVKWIAPLVSSSPPLVRSLHWTVVCMAQCHCRNEVKQGHKVQTNKF